MSKRRNDIQEANSEPVAPMEKEKLEVPTVNILDCCHPDYPEECKKAAIALHMYGAVIIKDPTVERQDNDDFLDTMERYFENSDGKQDARPEYHYQVGVTPAFVEKPRNHCEKMGKYGPDDKPLSPCPPEFDAKWRFFWRVGSPPESEKYKALNAEAVIPKDFPEWKDVMDTWGNLMYCSLKSLAKMLAIGYGMDEAAFTSRMEGGPHLLAPTGSDFNTYDKLGTVLAGYHYDLNFLTIHGKSRFPGLYIWTREGKKCSVSVPDGCLLVQAGKQIEYLTGGHVIAGFHEVVVTEGTMSVIEKRRAENKSLWRVSSTLFGHIQSDQVLKPLAPFDTPESKELYPEIDAGEQVTKEILMIKLHAPTSSQAIVLEVE